MDCLTSPSKSQLSFEEIPSQSSSSSKPPHHTPSKMVDREEAVVDDEVEIQERRDHKGSTTIGRSDFLIYNRREDPSRFLAWYTLAWRSNNEGAKANLIRLFPLALIGVATNWFLNMDTPNRLTRDLLGRAFIKRFRTYKILDNPIQNLSTIKMRHSENIREYIDRFNCIRHTCPHEPYLTHIIIWFILGLAQGIRREMKKTSTYTFLTEAYDATMEI